MFSLVRNYSVGAALCRAVNAGEISRGPCAVCDKTSDEINQLIQGHHHDYTKALDVTWLCPRHHNKVHRIIKYFGLTIADTPEAVKFCKKNPNKRRIFDKTSLIELIALHNPSCLHVARGQSKYFQEKFTIP